MSVFTIGHAGDYDEAIRQRESAAGAPPLTKRGPYTLPDGSPYLGGFASPTASEAFAHLDEINKRGEWAVYELDAAWPDDVWRGHPAEPFMRLKRDAVIVRKVEG